uniref:DDE_3 domain-containing protein n=1 Tax=Acrobeloides nanus TaxID=290746 RepID=A0A914BYN6_9BILA
MLALVSITSIISTYALDASVEHCEYEEEWTFQQNSAPRAKETQVWLRENVPDFINNKEWPPYNPDLNPLNYAIWGYLEAKAYEKPHKSINSLKKAIKKAWDEMPDEMVARVVDSWPGRLQGCIDVEGGYIE